MTGTSSTTMMLDGSETMTMDTGILVDMGDPDGARSILDEVVEEGDEAQRQEAQQLLDQLPR